MNWNRFTKQIKEDLSDMESKDELAKIWGRLETPIDELNVRKRKKNRGLFPFLFFGSITLLSALFLFYPNQHNVREVSEKQIERNDSEKEILNDQSSIKNEIQLSTNSPMDDSKRINDNSSTILTERNRQDIITSRKSKKSDRPSITKKTIITSDNSIEQIRTISETDSQRLLSNDKASERLQDAVSDLVTLKKNVNAQSSKLVESTSKFKNSNNNLAINKITFSNLDKLHLIKIGLFQRIDKSKKINLTRTKFYDLEEEGKKVKQRKKFVKNFRLNTGLFLTDRHVENKTDDGLVLNSIRDNYENSLETSQVELLLDMNVFGDFFFSTGLSFTQTVEQLVITKGEVVGASVNGTKYLVPDLVGGLVSVDGLVEQTITTNTDYKFFNRYRYIDIPLLLNYKLGFKKWHLDIGLGTYINLNTSAHGSILKDDFEFLDLSNESIIKNRIGLSYSLSSTLGRSIGKRFHISIGPSIRTIPSITEDSYSLDQKYLLLGGQLGISWTF